MFTLDALEDEKIQKTKCVEFCWTPCKNVFGHTNVLDNSLVRNQNYFEPRFIGNINLLNIIFFEPVFLHSKVQNIVKMKGNTDT